MMKIRIIELLNKIANGEKVPDKIKYNSIIYNWDIKGYLHYEDERYSERAFLEGYRTDMVLNDEVEILDDNTEEIEEYNGESFEQLGYEVGKMGIAIAKRLEKAIKEMRKDLKNE